uniref:DJ-1/PfpI domain-containing protein n=1 Tax=Helicotheca tamesis TaxID=374047 RepID=A0A7S2HHL5_9STRA|mmetsp:Transcript_18181/g.25017  ORF Transcript_18181/g.25017 Transcript_18181/m.25017 type:complete len:284 (+) Transcript_18181:67-918(+)
MGNYFFPFRSQEREDGTYDPSPFTLLVGTSKKTDYVPQQYETRYSGKKPILVVCTDEGHMAMSNGKKFNTGNHPIEMLVPMLHFRDAGFNFDIATANGGKVVLEMWAFPESDKNVTSFHESVKSMMENPKKLSDIKSIDEYSAIFIPGGHGCMINLPTNADLGRLLHEAHEKNFPTVTLCHGPATLLSTKEGGKKQFAYSGYETMCFTDKTDAFTPSVGYLPGYMPWKAQESLEKEEMKVVNTTETGATTQDRELITGDGPGAAHNLGVLAAPILVKHATGNE